MTDTGADIQAAEPAAPFTPADPLAAATVALLRARHSADVLDVVEWRGETTITVRPEAIAVVGQTLRDAPELRYDYLADITAVDWPEREPRFDVVYHLLSLPTRAVLRLKVRIGDEDTPHQRCPPSRRSGRRPTGSSARCSTSSASASPVTPT